MTLVLMVAVLYCESALQKKKNMDFILAKCKVLFKLSMTQQYCLNIARVADPDPHGSELFLEAGSGPQIRNRVKSWIRIWIRICIKVKIQKL